jgi:hypothetical protein
VPYAPMFGHGARERRCDSPAKDLSNTDYPEAVDINCFGTDSALIGPTVNVMRL